MVNPWTPIWGWAKGFNSDQRRIYFQVFVCFVIITGIIAPAPIWTALSDGGVVIPPLALVLVLITRPSNVGSTTLNSIFMIVGLIAGGLLAAVATWAAWAANGHSYSPNTATKGAVFGVIICVFSGILNAWRWRYDLTNVLFLFCCVGLVLMGGMASYSLPFVAWEAAFYMLALGAMAAVFSLLVGWFIYPVPASLQYRRCFSQALVSLAGALGAVEATLIAPLDPGTGRLAGAAGKLDPDTGTDAGLHETVYKVRGALRATRGKLLATQQHHLTVKLELDVYNSPKVFPRSAFTRTKICVWQVVSAVAVLGRPLTSGRLKLSLLQQSPLKDRFQAVTSGLQEVLQRMGGVVIGTQTFKSTDEALAFLDDAWLLLLDEAHTALAACNDSEAAFAVQSTASLLHVVGSSVRAAYVALSEAAKSRDPQAPAIAAERMDECPGWVRASDAFRNPRFRSFHAIQDLQRSVHAGKAGAPPAGVQAEGPHGDLNSPPLATVVTRQHPLEWLQAAVAKRRLRKGSKSQILQLAHSWRGSQHGAARRLWAVPMWAIFAVQYAVAVGIAVALTVTPPVLEKAFHNRSIEVLITVVVVWQPSVGGVHLRSLNRLAGTGIGAAWSYLLLGLTYGINGGSWDDTAQKWIVAGGLTAVWAGLCAANGLRYPTWTYGWLVAGLTVPLLTLAALRAPNQASVWADVGFRFVNVTIGIAIVWLVAVTVFPVSSLYVAKANYADVLGNMAAFIRVLPQHLAPTSEGSCRNGSEGAPNPEPAATGQPSSPKSPRSPRIPRSSGTSAGTVAYFSSFFSSVFQEPWAYGIKVQRGLGTLLSLIPFVAAEYRLFSTPHHTNGATIDAAVHATQHMADIATLAFAMKREHGALGRWKIPSLQYTHVSEVLGCIADAVEALQKTIKGTMDLKSALLSIDLLDEAVLRQIEVTLQQLAKDTAAGQLHARSGLTLPVGLLLYLGISSTQQVRLMYREAARGFLAGDTAGKGLVDAKAAQESALGPQHGAEQLIALMLSQQKGSPYPSLTSIQVVRQVEADSPKEAKEQVVGQVGEEFSNQENSKVEQFPKEFPKEEDSKVVKHAEEESLLEGEDSRVENHYSTIEEDAHVGEDLPVHDAAQGAPPSSGSPTPEDAELN